MRIWSAESGNDEEPFSAKRRRSAVQKIGVATVSEENARKPTTDV